MVDTAVVPVSISEKRFWLKSSARMALRFVPSIPITRTCWIAASSGSAMSLANCAATSEAAALEIDFVRSPATPCSTLRRPPKLLRSESVIWAREGGRGRSRRNANLCLGLNQRRRADLPVRAGAALGAARPAAAGDDCEPLASDPADARESDAGSACDGGGDDCAEAENACCCRADAKSFGLFHDSTPILGARIRGDSASSMHPSDARPELTAFVITRSQSYAQRNAEIGDCVPWNQGSSCPVVARRRDRRE